MLFFPVGQTVLTLIHFATSDSAPEQTVLWRATVDGAPQQTVLTPRHSRRRPTADGAYISPGGPSVSGCVCLDSRKEEKEEEEPEEEEGSESR